MTDTNFTVGVTAQSLATVNGGNITSAHDVVAANDVHSTHDITSAHDVNAANNMMTGVDHHVVRDLKVDRNAVVSGGLTILGTLSAGAVTGEMYADHVNFTGYGVVGPGGVPDGAVALLLNATINADGSISGASGTMKTLAVWLGGRWWAV
jgi:hypothetical protein